MGNPGGSLHMVSVVANSTGSTGPAGVQGKVIDFQQVAIGEDLWDHPHEIGNLATCWTCI